MVLELEHPRCDSSSAGVATNVTAPKSVSLHATRVCVERLVRDTLRSWRCVLIDASIVCLLKLEKSAKVTAQPSESISLDKAYISISSLTCLVQQRICKDFDIESFSCSDITDRVNALRECGIVGCGAEGLCYLRTWAAVAVTSATDCTNQCFSAESTKNAAKYGRKIVFLGDIPCSKNRITSTAFLLDRDGIAEAVRTIEGRGQSTPLAVPRGGGLVSPEESGSRRFREQGKFLAESFTPALLLSVAHIFHDIVLSCSVDPLTERGLQCFLEMRKEKSEGELSLMSESDDTFEHSPSSSPACWRADRDRDRDRDKDRDRDREGKGDTECSVDAIWNYYFLLDSVRVRQLQEHVQRMAHFPPAAGAAILAAAEARHQENKTDIHSSVLTRSQSKIERELSIITDASMEDRVKTFYKIYSPTKVSSVTKVCDTYKYHKSKLVIHLQLKYQHEYDRICSDHGRVVEVSFADFFVAIMRVLESERGESESIFDINGASTIATTTTSATTASTTTATATTTLWNGMFLEDLLRDYVLTVIDALRHWSENIQFELNDKNKAATEQEITENFMLRYLHSCSSYYHNDNSLL
jgi:hypothetical protein